MFNYFPLMASILHSIKSQVLSYLMAIPYWILQVISPLLENMMQISNEKSQ